MVRSKPETRNPHPKQVTTTRGVEQSRNPKPETLNPKQVPTTRGVEQSRSADSIVAEMKELASQGYREVTLLGQNIDAWGRDMEPKGKFSELLAKVGKEAKGIERVRLVLNSLGRLVQ